MNKNNSALSNIMKIMSFVVKKIETNGQPLTPDSPVVEMLVKKGYKMEDIDTAMKWIAMMVAFQAKDAGPKSSSDGDSNRPSGIRQLHASEALRLTKESQKMLLDLLQSGRISPTHFERVMEFLWKNDLRDVSPSRLELLLYMSDPNPSVGSNLILSEKVDRPFFIN